MGMTDQEIKDWVCSEYKRAETVSDRAEANQIRYRAKVIFDLRVPNPVVCPTCFQKMHKG